MQGAVSDKPAQRLRRLIESRDVAVVFQPIVDLNDGMIAAFEALSRPGVASGYTNPAEMFADAQADGLLWELEEVTRSAAIAAAGGWPRDAKLFLNTTPSVFADPRFRPSLTRAVELAKGLMPDGIVLEITELSDDDGVPCLREQVRALSRTGFRIAIDDVGAGTSGLNRVMLLRPEWLKLDREFIEGINDDRFKQNLVRFFVHFCRMSGVSVVAEGIESADELSTVIGLGVRYGQGYFLARPASPEQIADPAFANFVRSRWASVEGNVCHDPGSTPVIRLCKPALVVHGEETVGEVAAMLTAQPDRAGAVVLDGQRVRGWCPRSAVLGAASSAGGPRRVGELARAGVCALSPDSTIQDALSVLGARDDESMSDPIVVAQGGVIVGVVKMRDVLLAAAQEGRVAQSWRAPLTGLPARARADQHLAEVLQRAGSPVRLPAQFDHRDAAIIDIRRFSDFNLSFGYAAGDRLICELGDLLREVIVGASTIETPEPSPAYLAHLGDDRFLVTAPRGYLAGRLELLVDRYDRRLRSAGPELLGAGAGELDELASPFPAAPLRVLFMPGIFDSGAAPRDVYRIEQQLRMKSRAEEKRAGSGASLIITDARADSAAEPRRLSA